MRLLVALCALSISLALLSGKANANESSTSLLRDQLEGAFGDEWSPYFSVTGLTGLQPMGAWVALTNSGVESASFASPGSALLQIGTYVSAYGSDLKLRLSLAYQYSLVSSGLGDADFHVGSVELMPFYQLSHHRLGVGVVQHLVSKLEAKEVVDRSFSLGQPLGYAGEYGYYARSLSSWINLRYQSTQFPVSKSDYFTLGSSLEEKSLGVGLSFQFL